MAEFHSRHTTINLNAILSDVPDYPIIRKSVVEMYRVFILGKYHSVAVSVSGGSDSDILLDLCTRFDPEKRFHYLYSDTGLEYQATRDHISYLEDHYGIKIITLEPKSPIPVSCRVSQPFLSKTASIYLGRLQSHGFQWEDEPFEVLYRRYPKCKSALMFWCNEFGEGSRYNICRYSYLKEFMIKHPPNFTIGNQCCRDAKLNPMDEISEELGIDLRVVGVRKAEGGQRASIRSYLSYKEDEADLFRPILFWTDDVKEIYRSHCHIMNSDCYERYGLTRTGCAGCPCGRKRNYELDVCRRYEPELYVKAMESFKDSYEYERQWRIFRDQEKAHKKGQMTIWDLVP